MIEFAGIDLGGTKSEVQVFDAQWRLVKRNRVTTPATYDALVRTVATQVRWAVETAGKPVPVGIGAAGLIDSAGLAFTANLPAGGRPLPRDIAQAAGHPITYCNDCRALALSEAVFGAGRGHATVMSLILGTGVGGGVAYDGQLRMGPTACGGEFGHIAASAALVQGHGLPIHRCGCGRLGCYETYLSGPGLSRIARAVAGVEISAPDIGAAKDTAGPAQDVWQVWLDLAADLLLTLVQSVDPDIIILGGGLSKIPGIAEDLTAALQQKQIAGFALPRIAIASGGDASGARGAALAAAQEGRHV